MAEHHEKGIGRKLRRARNRVKRYEAKAAASNNSVEVERYRRAMALLTAAALTKG